MAHEWIKARLALEYVSDGVVDLAAARRICERAHAGLIKAKAERLIGNGEENQDALIGKGFWWARGHEALEQDWNSGDFSTWIDRSVEVKAFGVSFDFTALSELVPADKQAAALRRISVIAHDDWISARELHLALLDKVGLSYGNAALAEACQLGQLGARAMRATCHRKQRNALLQQWKAVEWDVPLWFWRDFTEKRSARFEWPLGKVRGEGQKEGDAQVIELQGLHFHRSGLINLGIEDAADAPEKSLGASRGRRPKYDWLAASLHIFGLINRGDFKPECQADVEKALIDHLADGDNAPGESTVRPYAKLIWDENAKA